jgi:hypothetical protein
MVWNNKNLRSCDRIFMLEYARKLYFRCHPGGRLPESHPMWNALSEMLHLQTGRQVYGTIRNVMLLNHFSTNFKAREGSYIRFGTGINEDILAFEAPKRFARDFLVSMGDETRGTRMVCNHEGKLVGHVYHPDVELWPKECGIPIPATKEELIVIIETIRSRQCLSSSFLTEALRSTSTKVKSVLAHTVIPMAHKGFTGFRHFKYWIRLIEFYHKNDLAVCAFATDSCSSGIAAAKFLMTPAVCMLELGVSYVGLSVADWNYFSPYLRPTVRIEKEDGSWYMYVPPCFSWMGDRAHHVRNFRKTLSNANITWVFFSEKARLNKYLLAIPSR